MIEGFDFSDLSPEQMAAKERAGAREMIRRDIAPAVEVLAALRAGGALSDEVWKRGIAYHKKTSQGALAWAQELWKPIIAEGREAVIRVFEEAIKAAQPWPEMMLCAPFQVWDDIADRHGFDGRAFVDEYLEQLEIAA